MEAKVEVKMTPKIMYDFMMYHTYRSFSGIFGIILGIAAFVMFGITLGKTELSYSMVYCLFGVWFIVYLPVSLYTKSKRQVEKSEVFKNPVTYILNDEGIEIVQGEEKAQCGWDNILKVCRSKKNVLIYSGKRNAFVLPKEAIGEQYDTLVTLVQKNMPKKKVKL